MSDESKKIEKIEQEAKESEVSDQDLENAAGGGVLTASTVCCPAPTAAKGYVACKPGPPSTL